MPDQAWMQETAARVVAALNNYKYCRLPAWPGGPPCELLASHRPSPCVNTAPFTQPDMLFDGPVPSRHHKGVVYRVRLWRVGNRAHCSCPAFRFSHGRECPHILEVREVLKP